MAVQATINNETLVDLYALLQHRRGRSNRPFQILVKTRACVDALKRHLETCRVCVVPPDVYAYCEVGQSRLDEALRAQTAYETAERNCASGFCINCD